MNDTHSRGALIKNRWGRAALTAVLLVAFAVVLVRTAWMSDDAYITLRAVDNLIHGYGPTWNAAERVQSFTHPLWMLVLSATYFVTREAYFTTIALGVALSLASLLMLATLLARTPLAAVGGAGILILSKAFVDYATSGLENALTYLLLACFFAFDLRASGSRRRLFGLALLTALLALNRIDAVLLVLPSLLLAIYREWPWVRQNRRQTLTTLALGFAPFVAWEVFAMLYYGFLVPNTAFAKLNTGIATLELLKHGLWYLLHSTRIDYFTSLCLALGTVLVLWKGNGRTRAMTAGALLYLAYVIWIGGDFMSGRFLAAPLFAVVAAVVSTEAIWGRDHRRAALIVLPVLLLLGIVAPYSPIWGDRLYPCNQAFPLPTGVVDERSCYHPGTALLQQKPDPALTPDHGLFQAGLERRQRSRGLEIYGAVGMYGFAAGPGVYLVDVNALSDPLMARLPMPEGKPWRIGHFERLIPAGYLETLATDENKLCNPGIAAFYDKLRLITRGPLFSRERLDAMWKMNTGQYENLLMGYGNPDPLETQLCNADGRAQIEFIGGPKLAGYHLGALAVKPGGSLPVTLYWQRGDEHLAPLTSFVHLRVSQEGQPLNPANPSGMWAQEEHPEPGGRLTTDYWGEQVYTDQFRLDLPADIPPGEYLVEVGWYNPQSGEQLEPRPETVTPPHKILWRSVLLPSVSVSESLP